MISRATLRALPALALTILGVLLIYSIGDAHRPQDHLPWDLAWPRAIRCVLGFVALTAGWVWIARQASVADGLTVRDVVLLAIPVHLVAIKLPPLLTSDLMYNIAIGHMLGDGQSVFHKVWIDTPVVSHQVVGGLSAYLFGFHVICLVLDSLGGGNLARTMRLHQVLAALAVFGTALLSGVAAKRASLAGMLGAPFERLLRGHDGETRAMRAAATATAIVLFSPLAVVEGTGNAHNDVFLALSISLFAVAVTLRRTMLAFVALALGLTIKVSAVLPVIVFVGALVFGPLRARLAPRHYKALFVAVIVAGGIAASLILPQMTNYTSLFRPGEVSCTFRSLECPVVWWLADDKQKFAAYAFGLAVRAAGGLFLLYAIARISRDSRPLQWIGVALFVFWVYAAGQSWFWYLLPVLPLVAFAPAGWFRAVVVGLATYPLAYGPMIAFNSLNDRSMRGWHIASELAATTLAPTVLIIWDCLHGERRAPKAPDEHAA